MRWLRYLLILASFGMAGLMLFILATERPTGVWAVAGILALCVLNALYLLWAPLSGGPRKPRIFGLLSLWLDAKESELKARVHRRSGADD